MTIIENLSSIVLAMKLQELNEKAMHITALIAPLPLECFPELRDELIAIIKEEIELEEVLLKIAEDNNDSQRVEIMRDALMTSKNTLALAEQWRLRDYQRNLVVSF